MELSELILIVNWHAHDALNDFARGGLRPAADNLAFIANKIAKELPNIELPPAESSESPGPAGGD